ncbi:OadG family protein [Petrocella sp. FN5]|uniref:OadG family protein n=1 Tax=Petrocella sp. FN5 TaxID=3032002 RepID=UPI0023DAD476|nr:OadG family protein [Petrocella sp. FN5]MDF1617527.1 OadG family protein [Petrocella sp. FN5]
MAEWLEEGLVGTINGVGTVFIVLVLIAIVISLFKYINKINISSFFKPAVKKTLPGEGSQTNDAIHSTPEVSEEDDAQLIAVIVAAIAASLETSSDQLQVRSFRRINQTNTLWNRR